MPNRIILAPVTGDIIDIKFVRAWSLELCLIPVITILYVPILLRA
jgi:hypothetical protein